MNSSDSNESLGPWIIGGYYTNSRGLWPFSMGLGNSKPRHWVKKGSYWACELADVEGFRCETAIPTGRVFVQLTTLLPRPGGAEPLCVYRNIRVWPELATIRSGFTAVTSPLILLALAEGSYPLVVGE